MYSDSGGSAPGSGQVAPHVAGIWRRILLRRPRWRAEAAGTVPDDLVGAGFTAEEAAAIIARVAQK